MPAHPELTILFERALETPSSQRGEFLDAACGGDAVLRKELQSLLDAHDSSSGWFEQLAQELGVPNLAAMVATSAGSSRDVLAALDAGLAGVYRIERELAGGGMSRVFLAVEVALGRRVVIKTLPQAMAAGVSVDRFRREIAVSAQLQHPNIVPLLNANASGGLLYYTMPFVSGQSLRERLTGGALPLDDALTIWRDVLDALAYAHANGVVHRDVKPGNILLSGRHGMVTDFGIARAIEAAATVTSIMMTGPIGTPAYMAPEQKSGNAIDHRADLYAAGLVMYEMLAGQSPFAGLPAEDLLRAHSSLAPRPLRRPDVPDELAALIMACLAQDPGARPASAERILAELDRQGRGHRWTRAFMQRPRTVAAGLGVASLAVVAIVSWRWNTTREGRAFHTPPDSAVRLYQRGMAENRLRTIEGAASAMNLFERAIAVDSEYAVAWAGIARTAQFAHIRNWTLTGRTPDSMLALAVRASRRALQLDSASAEAWTVAGKVAGSVDVEDRRAALNALGRAVALDSNYAEAWFELGLAHEEALHPVEAQNAWRRAVQLDPRNAQSLAFLAYHYLWHDDFDEAKRWADSAVVVEPAFFLARDASTFLALAMNHPDVAMRHAEAVQRTRGHEPPMPYCLLAAASARRGDLASARRYALQAESLVSTPRASKHDAVYLGIAWTAVGDTLRALRWLSAYSPRADLHFQLHLKRDPALRWIATVHPALLAP